MCSLSLCGMCNHVCLHELLAILCKCCNGQPSVYVTLEVYYPSFINAMWSVTGAEKSNTEALSVSADSSSTGKIVL